MFERQRRFLLSLQYLIDLLIVVLAWLIAYPIRFQTGLFPLVVAHVPSFSTFLYMGVLVAVVWALAFRFSTLYREKTVPSLVREIFRVMQVHLISFAMFIVIVFFVGSYRPSRIVFGLFLVLSSIGIVIAHAAFRQALIRRRKKGIGLRRALVVGTGELGRELTRRIKDHKELGIHLVGFLTDTAEDEGGTVEGLPVLGRDDQVQQAISENDVNMVFVALPLHATMRLGCVIRNVSDEMVDVKIVPDLVQYVTLRAGIEEFEGLPLISLKDTPLEGWNAVIKRVFDLCATIAAIPVLLPVMGALALAVKLSSPGPIFYRQERMGLDGRTFNILKFRSMRIDAENDTGAVWAVKDDPRRTAIGAFMRKTNLDEFPQFFNVLAGHMSLVGPRPERPVFIDKFREDIPKYMLRHKVKAGITGWAQVNGWRGNTDLKKRIECDIYYIQNWSLALDLRIIWLTVFGRKVRENAY